MSEADQVQLSYDLEASYGVADNVAFQIARYTGESLKPTQETIESPEIGSRRPTDIARTSVGASGTINCVLSFGAQFDDWFKAVMQADSDWSTQNNIGDNAVSAANSDNSFNGVGLFTGVSVGDWVRGNGMSAAANNQPAIVTSKPSNDKIVVGGTTLVDESAAVGKTVQQASLINDGATRYSAAFEKKYDDLTNIFQAFLGGVFGGMTLRCEAAGDGLVQATFDILAKSSSLPVAAIGNGSYTAKATTGLFNVVDHVKSMLEGSAAVPSHGFDMSFSNTLRERKEFGVLGSSDVKLGPISVSGTFRQYFADTTLVTKATSFTESALAFIVAGDGGAYVIYFPAIHYGEAEILAGSRGSDVIASLPFQAKEDATLNIVCRIARFTDA